MVETFFLPLMTYIMTPIAGMNSLLELNFFCSVGSTRTPTLTSPRALLPHPLHILCSLPGPKLWSLTKEP